ncbi:MAG TPA: hypothetical protein VFK66_00550 [Oryzihumus sp.]|nr:hypothetical protein [Oryzihumus sp.]
MTTRKLAMAGALGLASLGLIGAGAGATFTDAVASTQQITAGRINVQASTNAAGATTSSDGKAITFGAFGPTNSTFSNGAPKVSVTNTGTVQADAIWLRASDTRGADPASDALAGQMCVAIMSPDGGVNKDVYRGTLANFEAHPVQVAGPLPVGGHDEWTTEFYAGSNGCDSLTNAAEGGTVTPTITVSYQG